MPFPTHLDIGFLVADSNSFWWLTAQLRVEKRDTSNQQWIHREQVWDKDW
jgi:hypothetical protein